MRSEREPARLAALLELSSISIGMLYIGLLVLLAGGIAAGFVGDHWGSFWIWVAIAVLVTMLAVMYSVASPYYNRVREAIGMRTYGAKPDAPLPEPLPPGEVAMLLTSPRPYVLAAVGGAGLVVIIGLMVLKPG